MRHKKIDKLPKHNSQLQINRNILYIMGLLIFFFLVGKQFIVGGNEGDNNFSEDNLNRGLKRRQILDNCPSFEVDGDDVSQMKVVAFGEFHDRNAETLECLRKIIPSILNPEIIYLEDITFDAQHFVISQEYRHICAKAQNNCQPWDERLEVEKTGSVYTEYYFYKLRARLWDLIQQVRGRFPDADDHVIYNLLVSSLDDAKLTGLRKALNELDIYITGDVKQQMIKVVLQTAIKNYKQSKSISAAFVMSFNEVERYLSNNLGKKMEFEDRSFFSKAVDDAWSRLIDESQRQRDNILSQKVASMLGKEGVFAVVAGNDHIEKLAKEKLPGVVLFRMKPQS